MSLRTAWRRGLGGVLLLVPGLAAAEILDRRETGFTISNTVTAPVSPAAAWHALVHQVDAWWPKDHSWFSGEFSLDPRAGGCFCERAGERQSQHMVVSFVDPPRTLRLLGGLGPLQGLGLHGALEWRLEAVAAGTRITLHYVAGGYTTEDLKKFVVIVDRVQAVQLGALAQHLGARAAP